MKHKTSELTGYLLDAAVAKADGWFQTTHDGLPIWFGPSEDGISRQVWAGAAPKFSADWTYGGPIIEREDISLNSGADGCMVWDGWAANMPGGYCPGVSAKGPTPLIAAMRAYVAAKLGDEVDLQ